VKVKFWSLIFISVFLPLLVICASAVYFMQASEYQYRKAALKSGFKQQQWFYFKFMNQKIHSLEDSIQNSLNQKNIKKTGPLWAVIVWDSFKKEIVYQYFLKEDSSIKEDKIKTAGTSSQKEDKIKTAGTSSQKEDKIKTAGTSSQKEDKIKTAGISAHQNLALSFVDSLTQRNQIFTQFKVISINKTRKPVLIFASDHFSSLNKNLLVLAFLKDSQFFQIPFTQMSAKNQKMFLINHQGQLLSHQDSKHLFKVLPKSSSIRETIKSSKMNLLKPYWSLKDNQDSTGITLIQKWHGKDAFLVTKATIETPLLVLNSWSRKWVLLCLALLMLILIGLVWTVSPLFSAYHHLKSFFISLASTGEIPYIKKDIKNSFLYFYNNRRQQLDAFKTSEPVNQKSASPQTFQRLLRTEVKKIKFKYPGLKIEENFETDIKLFGFENFMRIILNELLVNAIESMGSYEIQNVIVSTKQDKDQFIFSIKDGGVGLLKAEQTQVFELYYSTKSKLGVGLNLVHSIVKSNNGTIDFRHSTSRSKGLEVVIALPLTCFLNTQPRKTHLDFNKTKNQEAVEVSF